MSNWMMEAICQSPRTAFRLVQVSGCRIPEAEEVIKKDSLLAVYYAIDVIKDRWREAEAHIMKNPNAIYTYSIFVIKGRWLEAESIILNSAWEKSYRERFNV